MLPRLLFNLRVVFFWGGRGCLNYRVKRIIVDAFIINIVAILGSFNCAIFVDGMQIAVLVRPVLYCKREYYNSIHALGQPSSVASQATEASLTFPSAPHNGP